MSNIKYYPGKEIGDLTIIKRVEDYIHENKNESQYLCKCKCKNYEVWTINNIIKRKDLFCEECYFNKYKKYRNEIFTYKNFTGSIHEICSKFNLNEGRIRYRIKNGLSFYEAIEKSYYYNGQKIYYNDELLSIDELAKKYNKSSSMIRKKINQGYSIEEILSSNEHKKYTYKNFTGTLKELSKKFNIDYTVLVLRIRRGWGIDKAISTIKFTPKQYTYKNFTGSIQQIIDYFELNVSSKLIDGRLRRGWSIEDAIEKPFKKYKKEGI